MSDCAEKGFVSSAVAALTRHREMIARICALAQDGLHDQEIARILTQEGHHSPWEPDKVLPVTGQRIRLKHRLKSRPRQTRWPVVAGNLTVNQLATRLGIPIKWVYTQLRRGSILSVFEAYELGLLATWEAPDAIVCVPRITER